MKTFVTTFSGNASELISKAKNAAANSGVDFNGDEHGGTFSGKGVEGYYKVNGKNVEITVTSKPLTISWGLIESAVKKLGVINDGDMTCIKKPSLKMLILIVILALIFRKF
jgi:hypothetical protein